MRDGEILQTFITSKVFSSLDCSCTDACGAHDKVSAMYMCFPFFVDWGDVVSLELNQHSLESSRSAVYWTFGDCHQRLVVRFNGHWFAVDVIIELVQAKTTARSYFSICV